MGQRGSITKRHVVLVPLAGAARNRTDCQSRPGVYRAMVWVAAAAFWISAAIYVIAEAAVVSGALLPSGASPRDTGKTISGLFQTADTVFGHLDQEKGLASPVVTSFAEDGDGFLWIGTQGGLARWDGYRMRTYQMKVGEPGSLPDNIIKTLFTDAQGRLWVGTNQGGIARFDKKYNRFTNYSEGAGTANYGRVAAIVGDGGHGLWVGTDIGLDHLDTVTGIFTHFHDGENGKGGVLDGKRVTSLVREPDGRFWVGTSAGLFQGEFAGKNLVPVAIETPLATPVTVLSLLRDTSGALWIGTLHGAFILRHGAALARAVHETGTASPLDDQRVSSMVEARAGMIWLGTFGQGIVVVDTSNMATHRIRHDIALPASVSDDTVATLYCDRAGTVWVGTRRGANSANTTQVGIWTMFGGSSRKGGIADADVLSVLVLKDGRTWLGLSNNGVDIFDESWVRVGSIRSSPDNLAATLPEGTVNALEETPQGTVYIGTSRGLYRAERNGAGLAHVTVQPDFPNRRDRGGNAELNISAAMCVENRLWIGTDNGLWNLDLAAPGKLSRPTLHGQLTDSRIILLARGQGDDLWVGTELGLNRVALHTMEVEPILPDPRNPVRLGSGLITSMVFDSRARLWVGTMGGGINLLEGRDKGGHPIFRRLTEGLPNGNIDKLLQASDGSIWAATDSGLEIIDPETFAIRPLQAADGLGITAYWNNVGAKMVDGTLVFGGVGGITLAQPGLLKPWNYMPSVVVTTMRIGGTTVVESGPFGETAGDPVAIKSGGNRVAVEFAALDYTAPDENHYAYRLNGYDKEWITSDATQRLASYTNLPPGKYTLFLRGSNRAGLWSKTREVHLLVLAAWYQTLWFHVLLGVLSLILAAAVYQGATAVSRQRQCELRRQVAVRTGDLQRITVELQESQHKLEAMAFSDSLTGLPNRPMFTEHFRSLLSLRQREPGTFAMLMLDLDGFKEINDTHGHDAGDAVLKTVASRLKLQMRELDCFARLGGDEFAMLLSGPIDAAGVELVCERIAGSLVEPVLVGMLHLQAALSVGVVFYPEGGDTQDALYKSADLALYRAKRGGKHRWSW